MSKPDFRRPNSITANRLALAGLLAFTLLVRGGVFWAMRENLKQDPDAYREIAENLLRQGQFALGKRLSFDGASKPALTAYRPPLYPVVLSNLPTGDLDHIALWKVAVFHVLLGVSTVWLTWLTARRLANNSSAAPVAHGVSDLPALLAGLLVACDPILLNQQTLLMTETLAAFLAIFSLWCLARFDGDRSWFNAALGGGSIGLAVLCRPTFLPWLGLVGLAMLAVRHRSSESKNRKSERNWLDEFGWRVANIGALVVGAAAVMSPWAIRNYRVFGKPIVTTTHGGYTLLLGNNNSFYDWLESDSTGLPWSAQAIAANNPLIIDSLNVLLSFDFSRAVVVPQSELRFDSKSYEIARRTIAARPTSFVRACLYRLGQLWSPLPHKLTTNESTGRRLLRSATCAWYCGVYLLVAVAIWRLRWKLLQPPWIWGVLLCLAFTAVHTLYWTNLRMRAPLMPFVAIVAAAATSRSKFGHPRSGSIQSSKLLNPEPRTLNP
jgi:hypothetical protein